MLVEMIQYKLGRFQRSYRRGGQLSHEKKENCKQSFWAGWGNGEWRQGGKVESRMMPRFLLW